MIGSLEIRMKSYLSTHHLWSAYHLMSLAKKIEDEHTGRSRFDHNHRAYVLGAITCGAAFLEAAINEVFVNATDERQDYISTLGREGVERLKLVWELTEERNKFVSILEKYQLALKYLGHELFDPGQSLFENAKLVVELRNEVIHFKPRWGSRTELTKFEKKLDQKLGGKKYPTNKLMEGAGNPFFPDHCLGYGCCAWTIDSVKGFADEFFQRIGIKPNYQVILPGIIAEAGSE